jgi:23S rRNA maturation mini-RNase III
MDAEEKLKGLAKVASASHFKAEICQLMLQLPSFTFYRYAWLGDRVLSLFVTKLLIQSNVEADSGTLTELRKDYECGTSHAWFVAMANDMTAVSHKSVRWLSTAFEAWIGLMDFEGNTEAVRKTLERYCSLIPEYVKKRGQRSERSVAQLDEDILVADFLLSCEISNGLITRSTALEKAKETGSWNVVLAKANPEDRLGKHHVADQVVGSKWRSRKGNDYLDFYFPCCGAFSHTVHATSGTVQFRANSTCVLWDLPESWRSVHEGKLSDIGGSRKAGGGSPGNHIPRGKTPFWTCCKLSAEQPGCKL